MAKAKGKAVPATTAAAPAATAVDETATATATAVAPRPSLASTIVLSEVVTPEGAFTRRDTFKYNRVNGGALAYRQAFFRAIAMASKDTILALTREQRNCLFGLCKSERARYYGTATRRQDSAFNGAKAGEPLPQLEFDSKPVAASYGASIRAAMSNLQAAVFGTQV